MVYFSTLHSRHLGIKKCPVGMIKISGPLGTTPWWCIPNIKSLHQGSGNFDHSNRTFFLSLNVENEVLKNKPNRRFTILYRDQRQVIDIFLNIPVVIKILNVVSMFQEEWFFIFKQFQFVIFANRKLVNYCKWRDDGQCQYSVI